MSCQPSRSSDAKQPFASSAVLINIYFQEHKENIFHILACLTSLDLQHCLVFFKLFPWHLPEHRQWSAGEEAEASGGMGSLHDALKLYLATNLMFSSYLFMFDWCLVCFQKIVSSFIHFPIGRCYLKEGCENDVASSCSDRLTASCSNPAASNNHRGSNDEAMRAWHIYTSKIWTADDSRIQYFIAKIAWCEKLWDGVPNYNEIFQHIITSILL